jgi:hypothetical protein
MLSDKESDDKKETEKPIRNVKDDDVEGYEGDTRLNEDVGKDTEGYEGDGRLSRRFDKLKRRQEVQK